MQDELLLQSFHNALRLLIEQEFQVNRVRTLLARAISQMNSPQVA